jgi:hypothetical protein
MKKEDFAQLTSRFIGLPENLSQSDQVNACRFDCTVTIVITEVLMDFSGLGTFQDCAI